MNDRRFISELMGVFCMAGIHQQPEQSNYLAEGQTCKLVIGAHRLCKQVLANI